MTRIVRINADLINENLLELSYPHSILYPPKVPALR